jgi:hypothetical protein
LLANGFSLSHRINTQNGKIVVTGILGHAGGHCEQTDMELPPDSSGGKTNVHAIASAISYGKRYTSLTLTGIATEDDDAQKATSGGVITEQQAMDIRDALEAKGIPAARFCGKYQIQTIEDLPAAKYEDAVASIKRHKA